MDFAEQQRRPEQIVGPQDQPVPLGGSDETSRLPFNMVDYSSMPKAFKKSHLLAAQPALSQEKGQGQSNAVVPGQAQQSQPKQTVAPTYQSFALQGSGETSMPEFNMVDYSSMPKAFKKSHLLAAQPAPSQEKVQGLSGEVESQIAPSNQGSLIADNRTDSSVLNGAASGGIGQFGSTLKKGKASPSAGGKDKDEPQLSNNLPNGVFINAAGGALTSAGGGKAGLQQRVTEFAKAGANTFFVPILTTDGKVGMNTTDENSSKVHRDRKYEYQAQDNAGIIKNNQRTYWRDVVDETKEAVNASGRTVGKGAKDAKVVPWVESAFTTYVGRTNGPNDPDLKADLSKTKGFTHEMRDQILTKKDKNGKEVPIEFMNENGNGTKTGVGYLDPLDPKVQKNVREVISKAASKDYVSAIMVDDHFGIPLNKPEVRNAILDRHPVADPYRRAKELEIKKKNPKIESKDLIREVQDSWLRDQFTKFTNDVKADLKAKHVQLWASTNLPEAAKKNQGQDIDQWIRTGLVDNWNVQLYRENQKDFEAEYKKLQAQASKIPQVAKGQVPLSVSISTYANGKQLSPALMAQQARYAKDPKYPQNPDLPHEPRQSKKIKTPAVAFDDGAWLKRVNEQKNKK
jgi:Glycosyl hydrolase-like 10